MALTRERLEAIRTRLMRVLTEKHPDWAKHVRFAVRYALEKKVLANAPPPLPDGVTPDSITNPQRTALIAAMKNALVTAEDKAMVDEVL